MSNKLLCGIFYNFILTYFSGSPPQAKSVSVWNTVSWMFRNGPRFFLMLAKTSNSTLKHTAGSICKFVRLCVFMSSCYIRVVWKQPLERYSETAATTTSTSCAHWTTHARRLIDFSLTLQKQLDFPFFADAKNTSASSFRPPLLRRRKQETPIVREWTDWPSYCNRAHSLCHWVQTGPP